MARSPRYCAGSAKAAAMSWSGRSSRSADYARPAVPPTNEGNSAICPGFPPTRPDRAKRCRARGQGVFPLGIAVARDLVGDGMNEVILHDVSLAYDGCAVVRH